MTREKSLEQVEKIHKLCVSLASIIATPVIMSKMNNHKYVIPEKNIFDEISKSVNMICMDMINTNYVKSRCVVCERMGIVPEEKKNMVNICPECRGKGGKD